MHTIHTLYWPPHDPCWKRAEKRKNGAVSLVGLQEYSHHQTDGTARLLIALVGLEYKDCLLKGS